MANLGTTLTLVDANGNVITSVLAPLAANGLINPLHLALATTGGAISSTNPLPVSEETAGVQVANSSGPIGAALSGSATLAGVAGKTTYIRGLCISSQAVAAAVGGVVTITGIIGGTLHIQYDELVTGGNPLIISFGNAGLAASGQNTAIVVTLPAIVGGAASAVIAWGVQI